VTALPQAATTVLKAISVTTPARTILDLAGTLRSDRAFGRLVHEAEVQRRTDPERLREELARSLRYPGAVRLAAEIGDRAKPTRSGLEDRVVELLRRDNFPPFDTNAPVPGTPPWVEVDVLFDHQKLVIEVDGDRFHETPFRRDFDARKQAIVESAGYRVIRVREGDVEPELEAQTLRRIWNGLQ
jgi:hypothetical protein